MAARIQILLAAIFVVFAEGQLDFHPPFFGIPGLQHLAHQKQDVVGNHQPHHFNVDNYGHTSWEHHAMGHQNSPNYLDGNNMPYNRHHDQRPYGPYNPFVDGGMDPYFGIGPFGMQNFDHMPITYPGGHNIFDHHDDVNLHQNQHFGVDNRQEEDKKKQDDIKKDEKGIQDDKILESKPKPILQTDNQPNIKDKDLYSNPAQISGTNIINNPEELPPKTNKVTKEDKPKTDDKKDDKEVDINKKKDYLLIGSDHNGNNVYILHENKPIANTVAIPNANQPGNNIIYVPYNPEQSNNPVYQIVNGQPTTLPTNQVTPDKQNVNGITTPGQPAVNINTADQNQQYVLIYSNGQLIKIPGVVVNSAPTNKPPHNGNLAQGSNVIVSNTLPNNPQNMPVLQNPGAHVIYTTLPNQGTSGTIAIQIPNCVHANTVCSSGTVSQNNNNGVGTQPGQNFGTQPMVLLLNGGSNGYAQPSNMAPYQGLILNNQDIPLQPAVQIPTNSGSNGYTQPMVSHQGLAPGIAVTVPNPVATPHNLNIQPGLQIPISSDTNENSQPLAPNPGQPSNAAVIIPNPSTAQNIQNVPVGPQINSVTNMQPIVSNPGDQGENANVPSHDTVITTPEIAHSVSNNNALVLDTNNISDLGAQPAIMISGFKETADDNEHENKSKEKKNKKDKSKKKLKKNKSGDEPKEYTNKQS